MATTATNLKEERAAKSSLVNTPPVANGLGGAIEMVEAAASDPTTLIPAWLSFVRDLLNASSAYYFTRDDAGKVKLLSGAGENTEAGSTPFARIVRNAFDLHDGSSRNLIETLDKSLIHVVHIPSNGSQTRPHIAFFVTADGTPFTQALNYERIEMATALLRNLQTRHAMPREIVKPDTAHYVNEIAAAATLSRSLKIAATKSAPDLCGTFTAVAIIANGEIKALETNLTGKTSASMVAALKLIASESLDGDETLSLQSTDKNHSLAVQGFLQRGHGQIVLARAMINQQNGCIIITDGSNAEHAKVAANDLAPVLAAKSTARARSRVSAWITSLPALSDLPPRRRIGALLGGGAIIALFPLPVSIEAPAILQAADRQVITAPISARLKEALVVPGDRVVANETVIARFDTRELEAQRDALVSKRASHLSKFSKARANGNPSDARIAFLDAEETAAELAVVNLKIDRAAIVAPISGIVMGDNINNQVGEQKTIGAELASIAGSDALELEILAPARQAQSLGNARDNGTLRLKAAPGKSIKFDVERIYPTAEFIDDTNRIRVIGKLRGDFSGDARLLPGMAGKAKLYAGWAPLIWHVVHEPLRRFRMFFGI